MRHPENDGEHIWLRQSATFTVHGQTRTVEIAVPIRPGASATEIEALLAEAGVGMERLSQHLDTQIASLLTEQRPPTATASATNGATASPPHAAAHPAAPANAATPPPAAAPQRTAAHTPAPTPMPTTPPASAAARASAPRPPAPIADDSAQPSAAAPAPVATSAASAASAASPATQGAVGGADLTRAEFLAAAAELGLNANQVMERLAVRSLQGLNLREALEALRRQLLRADATNADADTASAPAARPATPPTSRPAAATSIPSAPRYFEEEDDEPDISFIVDESGMLSETHSPYATGLDGAHSGGQTSGALAADDLDDFDDLNFDDELEDVSDLTPPPPLAAPRATPPATPPATSAPNRRPTTAPPASAAPVAPATAAPATAAPVNARRAQAIERLTQLRMIRGGGVPTAQQRNALRNVVVKTLGEAETKTLVQDIWQLGNERLGAEQYDALISWGKADEFEEEVVAVNELLRAEHEQALATSESAAAPAAAPPAPSTAATTQRPRAGRPAAPDAPPDLPRNR